MARLCGVGLNRGWQGRLGDGPKPGRATPGRPSRRRSAGLCGGAPSALPAAVRAEHVAQARESRVIGGALLVVHHQEALGTLARLLGDPTDRLSYVFLGGLAVA